MVDTKRGCKQLWKISSPLKPDAGSPVSSLRIEQGDFMIRVALAGLALVAATDANAQSLSGKVTGAVGGLTGSATGGASAGGGGSNPFSALNNSGGGGSLGPGGEAGGGVGVRVGDKTVILKGAVGVEDGRSGAFRAGAGVPF